jgi:arylsulfatase A-like enzyme
MKTDDVRRVDRRDFLRASASCLVAGRLTAVAPPPSRPNIVLIYADDLGYGDVSCYGATSLATPNIDRLAAGGCRFLNAHAPAATCTPSRYALLTGEYAWRRPGTSILPGDAAAIIEPGRTTLASVLHSAGYETAVVGKWHLGLGRPRPDWNGLIAPGPQDIGFDHSFLIPATGDRVPCVFVENGRVVGLDPADPISVSYGAPVGADPTGREHPELLTKMRPSYGHDQAIVNGISRIGYMSGGRAARWVDEDIADTITGRAVAFIERRREAPFFLYFATHDIHVPRVPHPRFAGKSGMGPRGDAILQLDDSVGRILDALDRQGLTRNTLVLFTSDNGPVVDDGYRDEAAERLGVHRPGGPLRGGKYSAFDAGTRVPFVARWPGHVRRGTSSALVSQVDLTATAARLTGQVLGETDAPDSLDMLAAFLGQSAHGRDHLVEQAGALSIIAGRWKYIEPHDGPKVERGTNIELGNDSRPQLFDLSDDLGERHDVASRHPGKVRELAERLAGIRRKGRTRG